MVRVSRTIGRNRPGSPGDGAAGLPLESELLAVFGGDAKARIVGRTSVGLGTSGGRPPTGIRVVGRVRRRRQGPNRGSILRAGRARGYDTARCWARIRVERGTRAPNREGSGKATVRQPAVHAGAGPDHLFSVAIRSRAGRRNGAQAAFRGTERRPVP